MAAVNAGKPCDDGNVCTEGDVCATGLCKAGANTCKCNSDADCATQEDGDLCNGTLVCNKTKAPYVCQVNPATVVSCPSVDDNFCQKNSCVPKTGKCQVAYLHNDEPCNDGTPCTVGEICKQGVCALPTLDITKPCDDGNPCTDDSCNPKAGCVNAANAATCTDGDACTSDDGCKGGSCSAGKAVDCDDKNACTTEVCNKLAGCVSFKNSELCNDGNACTSGETCKAGACGAGVPKDCGDGKPCTLDSCDKATGACSSANADAAKICDDGVACTIESCDPVKGCVNTPSAGPCDDKVACTADACEFGIGCTHGSDDAACNDNDSCTQDVCSAAGCQHPANYDGAACSDGDACTQGDGCKAGKCAPGPKSLACGAAATVCIGKADGATCDDGDGCTKDTTCQSEVCAPTAPVAYLHTLTGGPAVPGGMSDGPAIAAALTGPTGVAQDAAGNIWFSEAALHVVRRLGPDGVVVTVAGMPSVYGSNLGKGSGARFSQPYHLAIDGQDVVVADMGNHQIKRVTPDGTVTLVAGQGGSGWVDGAATVAKFNSPRGVAVAKDGTIYVADTNNHRIRKIAKDGTVSTFAGSTAAKKDGTGTNAAFSSLSALAWAKNGDLFVADSGNHAIRRITAAAVVTTVAGGGSSGWVDGAVATAKFNDPHDVAVDPSGLLLIADRGNSRLRALGLDGKVWTVANTTACAHHACINGPPLAAACDPCVAKVCAVDPACCASTWTPACVAKVGPTCGVAACSATLPNDGKAASALLQGPMGVASAGLGRMLVADTGNKRLRALELRGHSCDDGNPCTTDSCDPATGQCATAPSTHCNDGNPCTADSCDAQSGACTWKSEPDGKACNDGQGCALALQCTAGQCQPAVQVTTWSGKDIGKQDGPLQDARYYKPARSVRDPQGNVYVVETGNHCVRKISAQGIVTLYAGSAWYGNGYQDGPPTAARFSYPTGIAADGAGNVYVADRNNHCIRKIAPDGSVSTLAGTNAQGSVDGIGKAARFKSPNDVVSDAAGNLWVSDESNHMIRAVSPTGVVTTVAGAVTYGYVDGAAASARFFGPRGLGRDAAGNLYIADGNNHTVRKLSPAGVVTTFAGLDSIGSQDGNLPYGVRLNEPNGLGVDAAGVVWVTETGAGAQRIRALVPGGRSYTVAGGATSGVVDGVGAAAQFAEPTGVLPLPGGEVLVSGNDDHRLRKLKPALVSCDDANACTADVCTPKLGCQHVALGTDKACDDGDACTANDLCSAGLCKSSAPVANCPCKPGPGGGCNDGNPCTLDTCALPAGCAASPMPAGTPCDDGNACTANTWCTGGKCVPQPSGDWVAEPFAGPEGGPAGAGTGLSDGLRRPVGGTQAGASFGQPTGLAMDGAGQLWVADLSNHLIRRVDPDGNVRTPAGSLFPAAGHADGKAVVARFYQPDDVATDAAGNVYVADYGNHVIRKLDAQGNVTTLAGNPGKAGNADGKGSAATFTNPRGLVADPIGNVFVADTGNNRIRKVTPDGQVTTLAGSTSGFVDGQGSAAAFNQPRDLALLPDGALAVADTQNHAIRKLTLSGFVTTLAGGAGSGFVDGQGLLGGRFFHPTGLVADAAGVLYIAEESNLRVRRLDPDGTVTTLAGSGKPGTTAGGSALGNVLSKPRGIAIDAQGRLYVSDASNCRIVRLRQVAGNCDDGNPCTTDVCDKAAGCKYGAATAAQACNEGPACSVATCDAAAMRCVYAPAADGSVCDAPGACQKQCRGGGCMAAGLVTTLAGGDAGSQDGPAATARFNSPHRVAVDKDGALYVADTGNNRIRKIAADGTVSTVAGGVGGYAEGKGNAAKFAWPMGVAVTADGSLLVADRDNHRIRKVAPDGTVSTLAGSAIGLADGPGVLAKFSAPSDVVVDTAGSAYVTDTGNHRIRKITVDGAVTSLNLNTGGNAIDGPAAAAKLAFPLGLAVDGSGNVWIADTNNQLIRRMDIAGSVVTIAGNTIGFVNGAGRFAGRFNAPVGLALLPDGSVVVAEKGNASLRRVSLDGSTTTLAGAPQNGFADGMGGDARFYNPHGVVVDKLGNLIVADSGNNRIRKVWMQWSGCADLTGASKYTAGSSCKAIQAVAKWSGSPHYYVDPNGGSKADAWKTTCDQTTDGGGWTRVDASVPAATVDQLRGGEGQMLLKCSDTAANGVISPKTAAPWSWTTKTAVAGEWSVGGNAVVCGADPAFGAVTCGFGYGCSNGAADKAAFVLPGVVSGNQCANDKAAMTGTAFTLCGSTNYGGYSVFVRGQ